MGAPNNSEERRRSSSGTNGVIVPRELSPAALSSAGSDVRLRYDGGWRSGKPTEDPDKVKRWGVVAARPSEYLVHMRRGEVLTGSSGQGASCWKWPWDSVAIVPTTVQRLQFVADQVSAEKVGVQVTGLAVYRIADPVIAYRMLNFSYPERASEKLEQLLVEMFIGATRRLVANLSVEECLTRRKEGLASELMREIAPVVSGSGRLADATQKGWGVVIDTIEVQEKRSVAQEQARLDELTSLARVAEAKLSQDRAMALARQEAELEKLAAEEALRSRMLASQEQTRLDEVAADGRLAEARVERARALAQMEQAAALERTRLETEIQRAQTDSEQARLELTRARRAQLEEELAIAELESRRGWFAQELELSKARALREIENSVSSEVIQLTVAQQLPNLAAAFHQKMGEVHVTAVDGANPFGYVAAAVEGVLGLARSAGLKLPSAKDGAPPGEGTPS